jgi:hypothetical protein
VADETRRYERIDIELPCRLFIPGEAGGLRFEAFTATRNLGLGGIFVKSSFLLKEGLQLHAELALPGKQLTVRGQVTHSVPLAHKEWPSGMGLEFLGVDSQNRETLLRFFAPERYRQFYATLTGELPHLRKELPLGDVSLVLNLWEEWKARAEAAAPPERALAPGRRPAKPARR